MAYQSFEDQTGDSNSLGKLSKLQLPSDMSGLKVLDLGCNEGFFCAEVLKRGATYVVGIDSNSELIEKARLRVPKAELICGSWFDIPDTKFDFVLLLSAIHYEFNQKKLLQKILTHLEYSGTLILECGVVRDVPESWHLIQRHDSIFSFPSWNLLLNDLLDGYAVRDIGLSINQDGDPLPRYVFHCKSQIPTVILISGSSGSGKSIISREFQKKGYRALQLDMFFGEISNFRSQFQIDATILYLKDLYEKQSGRVDEITNIVLNDNRVSQVNSLIIHKIRPDVQIQIIEGHYLSNDQVRLDLQVKLEKLGFRVESLNLGKKV
jgi:SAM-dependent methyltransferase